ncbi:MAG: ABC transporter substrate-binding protein [Ruthenibacterium sp.]
MKKLLAILLALVLMVGVFAGCGAKPASSAAASVATSAPATDDPTQMTAEITWWAFPTFGQENADDPAGTYEKTVIEAFNAKYPNIKVNLETIDFTSGPDAITAAIEGNAAPDVLFDAPGRIIEYGKNGKLVALDDLFTEEYTKDVNSEALLNACKGNGTAYMYPLSSAPFYMTINEQQWKDAGALEFVNMEGDRTWTIESFEKALAALKKAGKAPGTLFCQGQGGDQGTRAFVSNLAGGQIANADKTAYAMNSAEGVEGLTMAQKWIQDGMLGNGVAYNGGSDIELFVNGNTAFTFCWGASTQLANQATLDTNKITNISLPFPSKSGKPSLEYLVNGFCVFNNGDDARAAAAKEFIKFVCDDATWGPKDVVRTGAFPVRSSFGDLYAGDETKALLSSWTQYYGPYYNTMDGFANMRTEWWNMLQAVTNGDDVKTVLDAYVEKANAGMKA